MFFKAFKYLGIAIGAMAAGLILNVALLSAQTNPGILPYVTTWQNATSTFAWGINLPSGGCFAVAGVCIGSGSSQFATTSANYWLGTKTTSDLAEGVNEYFTLTKARNAISTSATGLTYDAPTGVLSLTSGYNIPLTASTTEWASFFLTPSTRITAGTNLSWSGNTLNATGGGAGTWGSITGTLSDQTDLQAALDGKVSVGTTSVGSITTLPNLSLPYTQVSNFNTGVASYISSSTTVPHVGGSANGDILKWTGSAWTTMATSGLGVALSDTTGTLAISRGGTNATTFGSHMLTAFNGVSLVSTSTPTAARYVATSSTASVFPYASTTALSASGSFTLGSDYITDLTGTGLALSGGALTVSLANDYITPNMVKTSGQTDEYCLTYEATGTTWEWQACGTGGGSMNGWATTTSSVAGQDILHTTKVTDIVCIGGTSTSTCEFSGDPNTVQWTIKGSNGSSTSVMGSANNEWVIGTAEDDKSFTIASSSDGKLTGTTKFSIAKSGTTTSTNGFNITAGCYAVNGVCITSGGGTWGSITGTLSSQTDLQTALNLKIDNSTTTLPLIGTLTGLGNIGSSSATTTFAGNAYVSGVFRLGSDYVTDVTGTGIILSAGALTLDTSVVGTYIHSSSTIPKTYTTNTYTALQTIPNASTTYTSATRFFGDLTGTASLATALGANGSNCTAGQFPLGVDASGAVETCTDAWTEAENTAAAYLNTAGVNAYIHGSTTIPKTYTANTFTALQTTQNATTTYFTVTDVFAGTIRTGTWNGSTIGIAYGGTNATTFGSHMLLAYDGTRQVSTSTPTAGSYRATSTTATSTLPQLTGSYISGYGLSSCTGSGNKVTYADGTFRCETDQTGGGGSGAPIYWLNNGTDTWASSTVAVKSISATTSTSTFAGLQVTSSGLRVTSLNSASCDVKTTVNGDFYCGTDATGAVASSYPVMATSTSLVAGQLIVHPVNSTDILAVGGNSTSTFFSVNPNTNEVRIMGTTSTSTITFGTTTNAWTLGTSLSDYALRIASSTGLLDGATSLLSLSKDGALAVSGTTTASVFSWTGTVLEYIKYVTGTLVDRIAFYAGNVERLTIFDTGTVTVGNTSGTTTRNTFTVEGDIKSTWQTASFLDSYINTTALTADTNSIGPGISFDEDNAGALQLTAVNGASYVRFTPGATLAAAAATAGDGAAIGLGTNSMIFATNTPRFEAVARIIPAGGATTSALYLLGYWNLAHNFDVAAMPTAGCGFVASTTENNWQAVCRTFTTANTYVDTGIATSTSGCAPASCSSPFRTFKIEYDPSIPSVRFFIATPGSSETQVAHITTNIPTTIALRPMISAGRPIATTAGQQAEWQVRNMIINWQSPNTAW